MPLIEGDRLNMQAEITTLLDQVSQGDRSVLDRLFPQLYEELRRIAAACLRSERSEHTLQPTALVNEAYLKFSSQRGTSFQNRSHFLALCAIIMRRILLEHGKTRNRQKRKGTMLVLDIDIDVPDKPTDMESFLDFNEALKKLEALDARQVRIVELRFFGGLTMDEVAELMNISTRTAEADWKMARAWLKRELSR